MIYKTIIYLILASVFLSGCVGKREIDELALVMAVGIDNGDDGKMKITAQVARPADARGQTGAPSGQTGDPIWSASAEGETIFEAIRNLGTFSSRRVFWAHNYAIIISEDLAKKKGIADIIDFFTRNPELRMRTWILVTPDDASEVVSTITGLEVVPGEAIDKLFRYTSITRQSPSTQILDVQSAFLSESSQPVIARVRLTDRGVSNKKPGQAGAYKQVELAGAGVFKEDKLVGILKPEETRGLIPFIEGVESGVVVLPCSKNSDAKVSVELRSPIFEVNPSIKDGIPVFDITFRIYGRLVEAGCPFSLKDRKEVQKLEEEVQTLLHDEIKTIVYKAQKEYKSDFIELGKVFNNHYPAEWKEFQPNWESVFQEASVSVEVKADITDSSLLYKPTKPGE